MSVKGAALALAVPLVLLCPLQGGHCLQLVPEHRPALAAGSPEPAACTTPPCEPRWARAQSSAQSNDAAAQSGEAASGAVFARLRTRRVGEGGGSVGGTLEAVAFSQLIGSLKERGLADEWHSFVGHHPELLAFVCLCLAVGVACYIFQRAVLLASTAIGLSTGVSVLILEKAIGLFRQLRHELPMPMLGPLVGAAVVCLVFTAAGKSGVGGTNMKSLKSYLAPGGPSPPYNWPLQAVGIAFLAAVTLGSGCSLGPEGPAALLGANVAFAIFRVLALFGRSPLSEDTQDKESARDPQADEACPSGQAGDAPGCADRAFIEKALQGSKVVAKMNAKQIKTLMQSFRKVVVKSGEVLMKQGDEVGDTEPGLYITQFGCLDVFISEGDEAAMQAGPGKKVASYTRGGKLIGELAVLFSVPRAATVVSTTDCVLWCVDRKSFCAVGGRAESALKSIFMHPDSVVASGAAAGVAAGFRAPIAGIFFASEVVQPAGENSLDITNRLLAAALSTVVVAWGSDRRGALVQADFAWRGGNPELLVFMLVGVAAGVVSYIFRRMLGASRRLVDSLKQRGVADSLLPFVGATATVLVSAWTSSRVQFDGYGALNEVLREASIPLPIGGDLTEHSIRPLLEPRAAEVSLTAAALLGLLASKMVATALCQASGLVGGLFAPSLFMGACLGAAIGRGAAASLSGVAVVSNCATYVVVGAAAMMAAVCSVPITSVVLAVELAGGSSYEATLPLILGISLALYTSSVLLPALFEGLSRDQALRQLQHSAETSI